MPTGKILLKEPWSVFLLLMLIQSSFGAEGGETTVRHKFELQKMSTKLIALPIT